MRPSRRASLPLAPWRRQAFYEDRATGLLVRHGAFQAARHVLEFGCGTGRFASRLLARASSQLHALRPALVGGCRPLDLLSCLPPERWKLRHHEKPPRVALAWIPRGVGDDTRPGGGQFYCRKGVKSYCRLTPSAMTIPFVKAHGAHNDFLLTWRGQLPPNASPPVDLSRAICNRYTGVGADGWIILGDAPEADAAIELWNSDGSRSEISGNGTRCAAALLVKEGRGRNPEIRIATGAGPKTLQLLAREENKFSFEMNMGEARVEDLNSALVPGRQAVVLNVGNPQIAVFCSDFDFDWRALGAQLERHPHFPNRTNVSFLRVADDHTLDVRFFERGAGETMSSGTGSTGAAAAAIARGLVTSPVRILTPAGPLNIRLVNEEFLLAGPAEITVSGEFYL